MGKKKLNENDYDRILQLKQDGYANIDIADVFGVTASRIGQILRENGIDSVHANYMNFSDDDCQKIVSLYLQGNSATTIGKLFSCSRVPIVNVLHSYGIELDTQLRKVPKNDYKKVVEMYNGGMSQHEIAANYNCSMNAISGILKKMNVAIRPNGTTRERAEEMYELYKSGMRMPEIAKIYNMDRHTIGKVFKRNGFSTDKKTYYCDEHYFNNIDTQDKAYIAGLLWSDGCNQLDRGKVILQLQERDIEILEQIKEVSCNERPLYKVNLNNKNPNWQNSIALTWQSRNISQVLNDYGMVPRKSLVLEFPNWLDESLYPHFIRGYIDGDGSIYYSSNRNVFRVSMVGTKMFLDTVKDICESIGVKMSFSHKKEHNNITYVLSTTSNSGTLKILNWIYCDANLKLQRKYDKYKQAFDYYNINNSLAS